MTNTSQSATVRITLQLGNFRVEIEGHDRKELAMNLSAALMAIQDNSELSNSVLQSLGVAASVVGTPRQPPVAPGAGATASLEAMARVSKDANTDVGKLHELIELKLVSGYDKAIPILKNRPDPEEAVYVICYLMQVGPQWDNIALKDLKAIVVKENGFLLPGNTFGRIIERMEDRQHVIRSPTQKRNKPIRLSLPGVEEARKFLRTWCEGVQ